MGELSLGHITDNFADKQPSQKLRITFTINKSSIHSYYTQLWEVNSALYYRSGLAGNELYYAVYITEYATGEVVVPAYYLGVKIYEVYQTGETNSAIIISLPYTIDNVLPDFFIFSNDLEEIRVDTQNQMFRAVDGVLF